MKSINLFGELQEFNSEPKIQGIYKKFKKYNCYRKAEIKDKRCKCCFFLFLKIGNKRNYYKCQYMGKSNSEASDIRLSYVCNKFRRDVKKGGSMFKFQNGQVVKDVITGFTGVVMARCDYLTGCRQYGLSQQKVDKNGQKIEWQWFDEDRLKDTGKRINLNNQISGGIQPVPTQGR